MTELTGMTPQELSDWCKAQGMPAFRGKQIFRWIHQGADFDAMTNLPAAMRAQLKEIAVAQPVSIIDERKSQIDDTVKFLFGLKDGNCVEGVLMHYHHGYTLCISTQVGCRMGCKFCASTLEGCVRSLTAGEMLGEVLTDSTKKNLEMRVAAENGATQGKTDLAKRAKEEGLDAIHDTVHEMARDEARHGKAFEGLLKRYFGE